MRIEHISLLHLLHTTFGSGNVESTAERFNQSDVGASVASDARPSRKTTHGEIMGYYMESHGVLAEIYEAVPYAQPPIGSKRFEAPEPLMRWNGTRDCGKDRMVQCIQFDYHSTEKYGTEDCLYTTVVIPRKETGNNKPYPILIWLHGGSFQTGNASACRIEAIVKNIASQNIIFVAVNYRLGPIGFLTATHRDFHGNYGLDDQIEAIRWIRLNARNFGADPNNIVVGGMGAGAACASILAISPKTKGLFNGAILRSGSVLAPWAVRSATTENYSARLVDYCGCSYNQSLGMSHTLKCLKEISVEKLIKAWRKIASTDKYVNHFLGDTYFTPTADPYRIEASVLPGNPMSMVSENARMPIMIGVTSGESLQLINSFTLSNKFNTETEDWDLNVIIPYFLYGNYKEVQKAVEYRYLSDYPQNLNENEQRNALLKITSDQLFNAPAAREALLYAQKNRTVWAYIFEYENTQLTANLQKNGLQRGALHGSDCSFIFDCSTLSDKSIGDIEWNNDDQKITQRLISQIADFVHKRSISEIGFERFKTFHRAAVPIDVTKSGTVVDFYSNVTGFWHEVIPAIEQLHLEPQYRVLLQPCTMCHYPYKIPFYILLVVLILVTIGLLSVCIHRQQRVRQKPTYAIVHELQSVKSDEKLKVELTMP